MSLAGRMFVVTTARGGRAVNWVILVAAGLVEVAWSQSTKPTQNFDPGRNRLRRLHRWA
ncbi:hypothetical protein NLX83_26970 [Allokutzneria sp. A3M-2-11 16]|nr:hypothetical protein [Allokutzneria sp. A3M-2-11 16]